MAMFKLSLFKVANEKNHCYRLVGQMPKLFLRTLKFNPIEHRLQTEISHIMSDVKCPNSAHEIKISHVNLTIFTCSNST